MSFLVTWSFHVEDAASVEDAALKAYRQQRKQNAVTARFSVHNGDDVIQDVTLAPTADLDILTAREYEVARLVSLGASNADIARELSITTRTVKAHVANIFAKFGVSNRISIASKMIRMGRSEDRNAAAL